MKKYILEIIVFICGAVVMIYELAGSRILAPYLGTSIFVWTSLIGVILGSLSLGYYLGGRLADKQAKIETLDLIILATSLLILFVYMIKEGLLGMTVATLGLKFGSIFAALMLFAPASITMGMVSPYAARLKLNNLENSGRTIGNLYAISTLGSIVGTFMAGFVLIPKLGVDRIVLLLILILLILSLVSSRQKRTIKIIFLVLTGLFFIFPITNKNMVSIDTSYNRVWLSSRQQGDRQILRLQTDPTSIQSQMFVDAPNELAAEYTKYYDLAAYFKPDFQRTLIIGGCAYSYPKYFLEKYPDKDIDVVEIDPAMTKIAREYFNLKDDENLKIIHEDGRIFLNKNQEKYDIILGDAFGSTLSIPYQLTTKEAVKAMSNSLSDDGLVVLNLISAFEGKKSQFLQAEYKTFQSIFPKVLLYQVNNRDRETTQNIILVALKQEDGSYANPDNFQSILANEYKNRVETNLPILTDNFAPVDNYLLKAI